MSDMDAWDEHAFAVTGRSGRRGAPSLPAGAHVRRPKRIPPGGRDAAPLRPLRPLPQPRSDATRHRMNLCRVALLFLVSALLTGCAGSKTANRKRERSAAYADLPAAQRQLVDQGRIDVGMSTNAVYVAWGLPARVVAPISPGTFTWIYVCRDVRPYRAWKYRDESASPPLSRSGTEYSSAERETYYAPIVYECAEADFENHVVKGWREIPKPEINSPATRQELLR